MTSEPTAVVTDEEVEAAKHAFYAGDFSMRAALLAAAAVRPDEHAALRERAEVRKERRLRSIAVPLAFAGVVAATGNGAVVSPMTEVPDLITPRVKAGGFLSFKQGLYRHAVCPGDVTFVLIPVDKQGVANGIPTTMIRPLVAPVNGAHPDVLWTQQLLPGQDPGVYHVEFSVQSKCPTYTRSDLLSKFNIEVTP